MAGAVGIGIVGPVGPVGAPRIVESAAAEKALEPGEVRTAGEDDVTDGRPGEVQSVSSTACWSGLSVGGVLMDPESDDVKAARRACPSLRLRPVGGVRRSLGRLPTARSARLP